VRPGGDALEQLVRDLEAERSRVQPTVDAGRVYQVGEEVVVWPPRGLAPRTAAQQEEARRILDEATAAFDAAHGGETRHDRQPLRVVS
jgi:hypothetical protein